MMKLKYWHLVTTLLPEHSCSTTPNSVFYGDLGALRCLASGFGDIAFVDYRQLTGSEGDLAQDIEPSVYRVLCRNGSLAQSLGLTVDNDCALAHGVGSEIMARGDRSGARDMELTELLLEMDQWFGSISRSKMDSVFHMYSEFQGHKDLLFKHANKYNHPNTKNVPVASSDQYCHHRPSTECSSLFQKLFGVKKTVFIIVVQDNTVQDATKGLILPNDSGYSYVNNYKKLQEVNSVCVKHRNTSVSVIPSIIVLIAVFIAPFFI